jgi:hypothetical protein
MAQDARERKGRDPLSGVESDKALDQGPAYLSDTSGRVPKPPHLRFGTDPPSPRRPEHFFPLWYGLRKPGQPFQIVVHADATADGAVA